MRMRYVDYQEGGPEQLQISSSTVPNLGPEEVLIRVHAAGINRPDLLQRQGLYPAPEGSSPVLGLEVAGVIEAVGVEAQHWHIGQKVCALTNGGGYAEYVTVPHQQCLMLSNSLSFVHAAALPEALFTVWANLYERGGLGVGETVLIHGGAGGIGSVAIQMARITGARVYATAGTEEKCRLCESLGAVRGIQYHQEDFVQVIKQVTGRGVDVILDVVGGSYIQRNMSAAAPGGRIISIGFQERSNVEVNFMAMMLKRLTLTGSTLRSRSYEDKANICRNIRRRLWPAVLAERIVPVIHKTYPMDKVGEAHRELESGAVTGKLVLTME